jgi:hypothetical protein
MAGNLVRDGAAAVVEHSQPIPTHPTTLARTIEIKLSGSVRVDYEVTLTDLTGAEQRVNVRVEFPDEVRSMLEAFSWGHGVTIFDTLSQLGASYVEQYGVRGLLDTSPVPTAPFETRSHTFHVPLSYVRSNLFTVCAATV